MVLSKICQSSCWGRFANRRGCSVGVVSNKTPSHSQLLQIIKGHHMSLLMLSWQMTWLESKYETDESRAKKYFTGTQNWVGDPYGRRSAVTDSHTAIIIERKVKVVEKAILTSEIMETHEYNKLCRTYTNGLQRVPVTITLLHHERLFCTWVEEQFDVIHDNGFRLCITESCGLEILCNILQFFFSPGIIYEDFVIIHRLLLQVWFKPVWFSFFYFLTIVPP